MRLNQFIAHHTKLSRRQADEMIKKGLVEFNGEIAELFQQATENDNIRIYLKGTWQVLRGQKNQKDRTILFYKPIFSLTTRKDDFGRKTIYNFLPKIYHSLKPAGRLDYMSEGLLILTASGDLIQGLTHPKNESEKEYLVGLIKALDDDVIKKMSKGLVLDDYELNDVKVEPMNETKLEDFDYLKPQNNLFWYKFTLSEGRNNQIRKMCEMFGHKVQRLIRTRHGLYSLNKELVDKKVVDVD